ncbi:hypothetical protein Thiosp_01325 [Thiorhodovibrio litoralis]|nr:hypothetical protein Thiosp_01325 [Thiorhodovibrio litoralis]
MPRAVASRPRASTAAGMEAACASLRRWWPNGSPKGSLKPSSKSDRGSRGELANKLAVLPQNASCDDRSGVAKGNVPRAVSLFKSAGEGRSNSTFKTDVVA